MNISFAVKDDKMYNAQMQTSYGNILVYERKKIL